MFSTAENLSSCERNHVKADPVTPATAEGLTPTSLGDLVQGLGHSHHSSLFQSFTKVNAEKFMEKCLQKEELQTFTEEFEKKEITFGMRFRIEILKSGKGPAITFTKEVESGFEMKDFLTLFFKNQQQKFLASVDEEYNVAIYILAEDNFQRQLFNKKVLFPVQKEPSNTMTFKDNSVSLKSQIDVLKTEQVWAKFLSLEIPSLSVDDFLNQRMQLLNKSDKLNQIQNLKELKGILYPLTKQNMGSRILQKLLIKATQEEIKNFVNELKPYLKNMVADRYGNYVLQKIFRTAKPDLRKETLNSLESSYVELLKTKAGTFCLQGILDFLSHPELETVLKAIENDLIELGKNQYGTHFIQKLLQKQSSRTLINKIVQNLEELALNKYGIVIVKKLMHQTQNQPLNRQMVLNACIQHFNTLCFDEYGHYAIEEMLEVYTYYELQGMFQHIAMYAEVISQNQFSSSIIRKSIQRYGDYVSIPIIQVLTQSGLKSLMENSCGTFVLHRLLELTLNEAFKQELERCMMALVQEVNVYEKRQKWVKFFSLD